MEGLSQEEIKFLLSFAKIYVQSIVEISECQSPPDRKIVPCKKQFTDVYFRTFQQFFREQKMLGKWGSGMRNSQRYSFIEQYEIIERLE